MTSHGSQKSHYLIYLHLQKLHADWTACFTSISPSNLISEHLTHWSKILNQPGLLFDGIWESGLDSDGNPNLLTHHFVDDTSPFFLRKSGGAVPGSTGQPLGGHIFQTPHLSPPGGALPVSSGVEYDWRAT